MKHPNSGTSTWPRGSTRSASSPRAARVRCWPSGSCTGIRPWTCGTWTCGGTCRSRTVGAISKSGSPRRWACCTTCTGRSGSTRRAATCARRRCTRAWPRPARVSARPRAGSAPTGSRRGGWSRATGIPTVGRTGSTIPRPSIARCAKTSACSTKPRSANSCYRAGTQ